jgi:hypothetical protein
VHNPVAGLIEVVSIRFFVGLKLLNVVVANEIVLLNLIADYNFYFLTDVEPLLPLVKVLGFFFR